jgi:hypothetical protein
VIKKVGPWHRWVVIVSILSKDFTEARKYLKISPHQHSVMLRDIKNCLGVTTLNHAALKLNLLRINYEELPTWVGQSKVELGPGVVVDFEGEQEC